MGKGRLLRCNWQHEGITDMDVGVFQHICSKKIVLNDAIKVENYTDTQLCRCRDSSYSSNVGFRHLVIAKTIQGGLPLFLTL
jgi:hypothetical protein